MMKYSAVYLVVFVSLFFSAAIFSKESARSEWSFSSLYGLQQPSLTPMEDGLFRAPLLGSGEIKDDEGGSAPYRDFRFDNPLAASSFGGKSAFELQWHPNDKYSLLFGFGSWEKNSGAKQLVLMPSQGLLNKVDFERRAKLTYTEFTLGGTVVLWKKPKYSVYFRGSIHEIFDIDYREDLIFSYLTPNDMQGSERVRTLQTQTAGLVMAQVGLGGEWFFQKWISVGVEAGYLKSERNVQLRGAVLKNDFLVPTAHDGAVSGDNVIFSGMPYAVLADGSLGYMAVDGAGNPVMQTLVVDDVETEVPTYKRMRLDFSGWQVMFRINIYY